MRGMLCYPPKKIFAKNTCDGQVRYVHHGRRAPQRYRRLSVLLSLTPLLKESSSLLKPP
jgi:hypothetical protein